MYLHYVYTLVVSASGQAHVIAVVERDEGPVGVEQRRDEPRVREHLARYCEDRRVQAGPGRDRQHGRDDDQEEDAECDDHLGRGIAALRARRC